MRRPLAVLALAAGLALSGCSDEPEPEAGAVPSATAASFSASVQENFLSSCVENATRTSDGAATPEQLQQTCRCILGKVEQEYSEAEFTEFEKRLLGGSASDEESGRLVSWSTACAKEATS